MNRSNSTPMMQQYLSLKDEYPDALLFYRMGDFYEMFFEDAQTASRVLEITLTSRNKKEPSPVPMCGVPVRAVKGYIAKLIENGFKVAVCEQVEDPTTAKGLVKREVVRVITPGMILDDELLEKSANNFIAALYAGEKTVGVSCLDISTGSFRVAETADYKAAVDEILRIGPSELLLPETRAGDALHPAYASILRMFAEKAVTYLGRDAFSQTRSKDRLIEQFQTLSLEGFGCEHMNAGIQAAGALLHYVRETQKQDVAHLAGIETYRLDHHLWIDELSRRNLELERNLRTGSKRGSLLSVIDETLTPMGGRTLRQWMRYPLSQKEQIEERLAAVQECKEKRQIRVRVREILDSVSDLERLGSKIAMRHANARDLLALKQSFRCLPELMELTGSLVSPLFAPEEPPEPLYDSADLIERSIKDDAPFILNEGGIIKLGYSETLDELIRISRDGKGWIAKMEADQRQETGIGSLKVGFNKVFGYFIEVSKSHTKSVPPHFVRKQTLVNAERYITDELKTFEDKVLHAEERRAALEYELFAEIREQVHRHHRTILNTAHFIARLDCLCALAETAEKNRYVKPEINASGVHRIEEGRHPVVEKVLVGQRFVPNTISMDDTENQVLIITGPNMAGKSTVLRQVALTVLMAQMGSFVPAEKAEICLTDRIFTRVGALDNLSQGQSTFLVEMEETANIVNNATEKSLVIMDEIGRGTSTFDGLSIAWAVAEYLHDIGEKGVKTLFATHYHELTALSQIKQRVKNFHISVKEWNDRIIFLRKLAAGGTNRSYGIQVARLAGVPDEVVEHAKKILFDIENGRFDFATPFAYKRKKDGRRLNKQMPLFQSPEKGIIERLKKIDVSKMTPIDAINALNALHERAKSIPE